MATPPSQDNSKAAFRQFLASMAFLLSLFSLFCTLFTALLLWGATHAPGESPFQKALLEELGVAPFDRYAGLLALKMVAGLASLLGIALWNSRGQARMGLFRLLLLGDIFASMALLVFAHVYERVGPVNYFRVLTIVSVGLILVWAGAGVGAALGPPARSAGGR